MMFSFQCHFNLLTFSIHELMPDCNLGVSRAPEIWRVGAQSDAPAGVRIRDENLVSPEP